MARYVQLFVISSLLVTAYCKPVRFGAGIGAHSHTEIGADGSAGVGKNIDSIHAKGRGFLDWFGSLSGGAYLGNVGIGGTIDSNAGAGIRGKAAGGGKIGTDSIEGYAGGKGFLDKDVHANVAGDIHFYDANEIKELHDRNKGYANVEKDEDDGYGARKFGFTRW